MSVGEVDLRLLARQRSLPRSHPMTGPLQPPASSRLDIPKQPKANTWETRGLTRVKAQAISFVNREGMKHLARGGVRKVRFLRTKVKKRLPFALRQKRLAHLARQNAFGGADFFLEIVAHFDRPHFRFFCGYEASDIEPDNKRQESLSKATKTFFWSLIFYFFAGFFST